MESLHNFLEDQCDGMALQTLMKYQWGRLSSFRAFPVTSKHSLIRLAKTGFYSLGEGELVRCFSCECTIDTSEDEPVEYTHLRLSPDCALARGQDSENIPISYQRQPDADRESAISTTAMMQVRYAEFVDVESRRSSFHGWPAGHTVLPRQLVVAGFFFTGKYTIFR